MIVALWVALPLSLAIPAGAAGAPVLLLSVRRDGAHDEALTRELNNTLRHRQFPLVDRGSVDDRSLRSEDVSVWGQAAQRSGAALVLLLQVQEMEPDLASVHVLRLDATRPERPPQESDAQCLNWKQRRSQCLADAIDRAQAAGEPSAPRNPAPRGGDGGPRPPSAGGASAVAGVGLIAGAAPPDRAGSAWRLPVGAVLVAAGIGGIAGGGWLVGQSGQRSVCPTPEGTPRFLCQDDLNPAGQAVAGLSIGGGIAALGSGAGLIIWEMMLRRRAQRPRMQDGAIGANSWRVR